MVRTLLLPLTRDFVTCAMLDYLSNHERELKVQIAFERENFDPSETDRDARAILMADVRSTVQKLEEEVANLVAFRQWLISVQADPSNPLHVGNFWLLDYQGKRVLWLIYDPGAPRSNTETYVTIGNKELMELCDLAEVSVLSNNCPLYRLLRGKVIRVNAEITVSVDGNNPEVSTLLQVF